MQYQENNNKKAYMVILYNIIFFCTLLLNLEWEEMNEILNNN